MRARARKERRDRSLGRVKKQFTLVTAGQVTEFQAEVVAWHAEFIAKGPGTGKGSLDEGLERAAAMARARTAASDPAVASEAEPLAGAVWIGGGVRLYREAMALERPKALYLTRIHGDVEGDTVFPAGIEDLFHLKWQSKYLPAVGAKYGGVTFEVWHGGV